MPFPVKLVCRIALTGSWRKFLISGKILCRVSQKRQEEKRANCPKARKKAVPLAGKGHLTMQQKILRGQRFLRVLEFVEKLLDELFNSSNFVNTMRVLPAENKAVVQITQVSIQKRVCNTISRGLDLASGETSIRTTYFQLSFAFKVL